MRELLSHPNAPIVIVVGGLLFLFIIWKVLKSVLKLFAAFVLVAVLIAAVIWSRAH